MNAHTMSPELGGAIRKLPNFRIQLSRYVLIITKDKLKLTNKLIKEQFYEVQVSLSK